MATRNLAFITTLKQGVSENTTLILTFTPLDQTDLYTKQFPVAWKVLKFSAGQTQTVNVTYSARLGVAVAQIDSGLVQIPQSFLEMALGQSTTLNEDKDDFISWTEPTPKPAPGKGSIDALNNSGRKQDMSIGTVEGTLDSPVYKPVLVWTDVKNADSMVANFTPKLKIYAYKGYQETAILKGAIMTGLLGEWDLAKLDAGPKINTFHLFEDESAGGKVTLTLG